MTAKVRLVGWKKRECSSIFFFNFKSSRVDHAERVPVFYFFRVEKSRENRQKKIENHTSILIKRFFHFFSRKYMHWLWLIWWNLFQPENVNKNWIISNPFLIESERSSNSFIFEKKIKFSALWKLIGCIIQNIQKNTNWNVIWTDALKLLIIFVQLIHRENQTESQKWVRWDHHWVIDCFFFVRKIHGKFATFSENSLPTNYQPQMVFCVNS